MKKVKRKLLGDLDACVSNNSASKHSRVRSSQNDKYQLSTSNAQQNNSRTTGNSKLVIAKYKKSQKANERICNAKNNNAIPILGKTKTNGMRLTDAQNSAKDEVNVNNKEGANKTLSVGTKVVPIIKTRGMKRKEKDQINKQNERQILNEIDTMKPFEIAGGDTDNEIDHDGIELSVNGSDIEDFPEDSQWGDNTTLPGNVSEPGELSLDEETAMVCYNCVASKVVVPSTSKSPKANKYSHLKNDPEFAEFLDQMLDSRMAAREPKKSSKNEALVNKLQMVKSPSDTTIYMPILRKVNHNHDDVALIDKISNFVESIRIDNGRRSHSIEQRSGQQVNTASGSDT